MEFQEFPKIGRLNREIVITEKIDGTNAQVYVVSVLDDDWINRLGMTDVVRRVGDFWFAAGSRTKWITPHADNHGFARWAWDHAEELIALGDGRHFGEWWGSGIQRGYGLQKGEKRFSLFNVGRWGADRVCEKFPTDPPPCCSVVPTLYRGPFTTDIVGTQIERLRTIGSVAAPGFMKPEGVIVFHSATGTLFKQTLDGDETPKSQQARDAVSV